MANIKSDKKTILTSRKRNLQNSSFKSSLKTAIKAVESSKTKDEGIKALEVAYKKLDKACAKGIAHSNFVANQKSRLAKIVNALA